MNTAYQFPEVIAMAHFYAEFPTSNDILALSPTALAERLLIDLSGDSLHRGNFLSEVSRQYGNHLVTQKFAQAWAVLVNRCFLVESQQPDWFFVSEDAELEQKRIRERGSPPSGRPRVVGDRWIVEQSLGGGGQGLTSLVRDNQALNQTSLVIKELKSVADEQGRGRFAAEIKALQKLQHPNILRIVKFDPDADPPWYVSEYCAGRSLYNAHLARLDIRTRLHLFLDVCRGLAAAHKIGITHRDLKPENILLRSESGPAVLGDFGLCWLADSDEERLTRANEDIGSSFCRAPELFDGPNSSVAPTADIYCLGKLLYWIVRAKGGRVGRLQREEFDQGDRDLVTIFEDPHYEHINSLLRRMIKLDPADRFQDAGEAYEACERAFELFLSNYEPINLAPSRCKYCGDGIYHERSHALPDAERIILREWRIYECRTCGHTLLFSKDQLKSAW